MRSPSIEFFHAKIEKFIRVVQSYTDNNAMEFIIKACRLKPYSYVFKERDKNVVLHRWWFDEFGNSLNIVKKRIDIIYNDLRIDKKKIVSTDMYYGLSIDKVVKISKLAYICLGKDEDLFQDCCLLSLLGVDNHLRCYLYWYGEWQQVSPLLMGMKHLKLLASSIDVKYFRQLNNYQNTTIPCISSQTCLTYLPVSKDFLDIINKQYELLLPIFGK